MSIGQPFKEELQRTASFFLGPQSRQKPFSHAEIIITTPSIVSNRPATRDIKYYHVTVYAPSNWITLIFRSD